MSRSNVLSLRDAFRVDTTRGKLAIATAVLVLITPSLATFVSPVFLVLLVVALALSLTAVFGVGGDVGQPSTRLARAGYAMALNGVLLIIALFIAGFLGDFVIEAREGTHAASVGFGFTTVHILLGLGLLIVDDYRHASRSDI
jgi:hypothetical protein